MRWVGYKVESGVASSSCGNLVWAMVREWSDVSSGSSRSTLVSLVVGLGFRIAGTPLAVPHRAIPRVSFVAHRHQSRSGSFPLRGSCETHQHSCLMEDLFVIESCGDFVLGQ